MTAASRYSIKSSVRLGSTEIEEKQLDAEIRRLRRVIVAWAKKEDYWTDSWFQDVKMHRVEAPRQTDVLFLASEGPLCLDAGLGHLDGSVELGFQKLLAKEGFTYEAETHTLFRIFPESEERQKEYLALERWRWVQRLAEKRLYEIHTEVFDHFAKRPGDLKTLEWRQYEEFLDAVFKNQGFITELGKGRNDGGVDLRIYQNAAVPEMVTLVQAKRNARRPVQADAVAALWSRAVLAKAPKAIFATTSYFRPSDKKFAKSVEKEVDLPQLELVDAVKLGGWCGEIAAHLDNYFATGQNPPRHIAEQPPTALVGKIVVAHWGHNMNINDFAVIETDFGAQVILRPIGSNIVEGNEHQGSEVPAPGKVATGMINKRFTAFRTNSDSTHPRYEGEGKTFCLWDGAPQSFDHFD